MSLARPKPKDQRPSLIDVHMDTVGSLSNDYVDRLECIQENEKALETIGKELIAALKNQGREGISVRGVTLKVREIKAKFGLSVKRIK